MRLRTQLALAFLLFTIVPLSAITLYSYYGSTEAFRRLVAEETAGLANEMRDRMERVTDELSHRIERVDRTHINRMVSTKPSRDQQQAWKQFSEMVSGMGESAALVDSLEFCPTPDTPAPPSASEEARRRKPGPPPPPLPPPGTAGGGRAEGRVWGSDPDHPGSDKGHPGSASIATSGGNESVMVVIPEMPEVQMGFIGPEGPVRVNREGNRYVVRGPFFDPERIKAEIEKSGVPLSPEKIEKIKQELERANREIAEGHKARAEAEKQMAKWRVEQEKARSSVEASRTERRAEQQAMIESRLTTGRGAETIEVRLNRTGSEQPKPTDLPGPVIAHMKTKELVRRVLRRDAARPGDLQFVIDPKGRVHTSENATPVQLAKLGFANPSGTALDSIKAPEDWIVATVKEKKSGMTFGIARPIGDSLKEIRNTTLRNLALGGGFIFLALLGVLPISGRMTRNLNTLTQGVERLSQGDLNVQVPVKSRDEIGTLASAFNRMAEDLKHHQAKVIEQERLQKELEMCRRIQEEMLPREPLRAAIAQAEGVSIPARQVGGDFFNYFELSNDEIAVLVGDVSGKGVPAALLMANLQATLHARLKTQNDLVRLAVELDGEIGRQTEPQAFATLFMGIISRDGKTLRWVNAGHNPQFLLHPGGRVVALESTGRPLGLLPGGEYEQGETSLEGGDLLFLYTDGLVEATDPSDQEFGTERLSRILVADRDGHLDRVVSDVMKALTAHRGGTEAGDDATLLALRVS